MSKSPLKKNVVCCTDIIMLIVFVAFWAGIVRTLAWVAGGGVARARVDTGQGLEKGWWAGWDQGRGVCDGMTPPSMSKSPLKKNAVCCTDIIMLIVFCRFLGRHGKRGPKKIHRHFQINQMHFAFSIKAALFDFL